MSRFGSVFRSRFITPRDEGNPDLPGIIDTFPCIQDLDAVTRAVVHAQTNNYWNNVLHWSDPRWTCSHEDVGGNIENIVLPDIKLNADAERAYAGSGTLRVDYLSGHVLQRCVAASLRHMQVNLANTLMPLTFGLGGMSYFGVVKNTSSSDNTNSAIFHVGTNFANQARFAVGQNNGWGMRITGRRLVSDSAQSASGPDLVSLQQYVFSAVANYATARFEGFVNGVSAALIDPFQTAGVTDTEGGGIYIGRSDIAYHNGDIGPCLFLNTAVSAPLRLIIEDFIKTECGVTY